MKCLARECPPGLSESSDLPAERRRNGPDGGCQRSEGPTRSNCRSRSIRCCSSRYRRFRLRGVSVEDWSVGSSPFPNWNEQAPRRSPATRVTPAIHRPGATAPRRWPRTPWSVVPYEALRRIVGSSTCPLSSMRLPAARPHDGTTPRHDDRWADCRPGHQARLGVSTGPCERTGPKCTFRPLSGARESHVKMSADTVEVVYERMRPGDTLAPRSSRAPSDRLMDHFT